MSERTSLPIVVVGSGTIGGATGLGFAHHGHRVLFVDTDGERRRALQDKGLDVSPTVDLPDEPSIVFIAVPTPSDETGFDLGPLLACVEAIGEALGRSDDFHTVVVRSTVPPGTTERLVQSVLERTSNRSAGTDFAIAANPEFLRRATALEDFLHPVMIVLGSRSRETLDRLEHLYRPFGAEIRTFTDPAGAEFTKCAHNLYNATKISFWNEMWRLAQLLSVDQPSVAEVVAASAEASYEPRYGLQGGRPFDGSCLPKDAAGVIGFAESIGLDLPLIKAVLEVNQQMRNVVSD